MYKGMLLNNMCNTETIKTEKFMYKIIKKTSIIILILLFLCFVFDITGVSFANGWDEEFEGATIGEEARIVRAINRVIGILQIIGMTSAVIMLTVIGIKYVSTSPQGRADLKKGLVVYVIGAVMLLCTTGVLQLVRVFVDDIV